MSRIPYLRAIRAACASVMSSPADPTARRKLEQVCEILDLLVCDANSAVRLETQALAEYERLLAPLRGASVREPLSFAGAKAEIARLIASPDAPLGRDAAEFCGRAAAVERRYYLESAAALREQSRALENAGASDARGDLPDASIVSAYLSRVFGQTVEVVEIRTVSLGYSKATFLLAVRAPPDVPADLVIRMDRPFNFLGTTVIDEYPVLRVLHDSGVRVPCPYALERTGAALGQPFLVVGRVLGRNVGSHFSFPAPNPALCAQMAAQLAQIHSVPVERFRSDLRGIAQSAEEQIEAEISRYRSDWSALKTACPTVEAAFRWIREHAADAVGERTLVHGDFSLSNTLVGDDEQITAILDWEFAQLGVPASDIGWFYTAAERLASWDQFLDAYRAGGRAVPAKKQLDFYVLWGLLRLAVMNFQVESGFLGGRMHDIKHAYAAISFTRECVLRVGACLETLSAAA